MRSRTLMLLLLLTLCGGVVSACAEKSTRGITFEGPESEVSFQVETTDKDPDDED